MLYTVIKTLVCVYVLSSAKLSAHGHFCAQKLWSITYYLFVVIVAALNVDDIHLPYHPLTLSYHPQKSERVLSQF